ncbi:ABC transporter permease [Comamonadaceae bacterium PP-2]
MSASLLQRTLTLLATLLAASAVIFLALEVLPGNAAQMLMGADASPEALQALEQKLGLDRPALQRYGGWLAEMAHGEMGNSYVYGTPVSELVGERLTLTLPLTLLAMAITTVAALLAGIYAATRHNRLGDVGMMTLSQLGIAIPSFWFAILLILLFAVQLRWFAAGGFPGWDEGVWPGLKALILPALSLAVVQAAILARNTRSAILEVLHEDFVRTARAKGLDERAILWRHVLRNALVPVITVMGWQFASLLAGTIVVENVFYLPGIGRLIFQSIANRDLIVVRDCLMLLTALVILVNFLIDVLYVVIDPRMRGPAR